MQSCWSIVMFSCACILQLVFDGKTFKCSMNQRMITQMFISFASIPWSPLDHDSGPPLLFKLYSEKLCMKVGIVVDMARS